MYIDWLTWSVWSLGLSLLGYWCVQTYKEFKDLFARHKAGGARKNEENI